MKKLLLRALLSTPSIVTFVGSLVREFQKDCEIWSQLLARFYFQGHCNKELYFRRKALHQTVLLKFTYRYELSPDKHYFILYIYIMTPQKIDVLRRTLIDVKKIALNSPIWCICEIRKIVISFVCRGLWFNLSKEKDRVRYSLLS